MIGSVEGSQWTIILDDDKILTDTPVGGPLGAIVITKIILINNYWPVRVMTDVIGHVSVVELKVTDVVVVSFWSITNEYL